MLRTSDSPISSPVGSFIHEFERYDILPCMRVPRSTTNTPYPVRDTYIYIFIYIYILSMYCRTYVRGLMSVTLSRNQLISRKINRNNSSGGRAHEARVSVAVRSVCRSNPRTLCTGTRCCFVRFGSRTNSKFGII